MVELIVPTTRLHSSWLVAYAEWGPGLHEDGFGLLASDETASAAGFSAWVTRLISVSDSSMTDDPAVSGCIHRWIVDGDDVFGGIALRYGDSEFIRSAGRLAINPVLLVCDANNVASAATIEGSGGVFEGIQETKHGLTRRYWITTA